MARIVAVSVATPRPQLINGHEMSSSIVRPASADPIYFGMDGPEGNSTAMHTEQVCVFCAERYDHWSAELGIARSAWDDCFFGENLMIAGLTEEDVRVGDRLRTSAGVFMEVTGPRSNCAKLTWRMGARPAFLKTLVRAGWIGYYLRVLSPGWVRAGDAIEIDQGREDQPTIGALTRAIHEDVDPDLDFLRAAAQSIGLGLQTREVLRKRICDVEDVWRTRTNRWTGWRRFVVTGRVGEAPGVTSLRLRPEDGGPIAPFRAGQFATVRLPDHADNVVRSWSFSDYQDEIQDYRLTIRQVPGGVGSAWAQQAEVGEVVELQAPSGQFVLDRSTLRRVILISAGIGVTPMLAMLKAHAARGDDASPLLWLHCTPSSERLAFREEVEAVLTGNPAFQRQLHFTDPLPTDRLGVDYDRAGRITPETIAEIAGTAYQAVIIGRSVAINGHNSEVFICGPKPFEDAIRTAFIAANTIPHYIRAETFSGGMAVETPPAGPSKARVSFRESAMDVDWDSDLHTTLLDLALDSGIDAPYNCRAGTCGSCLVQIVGGTAEHLLTPQIPVPTGSALLCCSRPTSANIALML